VHHHVLSRRGRPGSQTARRLLCLTPVKHRLSLITAEPTPEHPNPLDPVRILADLPERERENFLHTYREAMELALNDPAEWAYMLRVLRGWRHMCTAVRRPGFYEAQEAARGPVQGGMLLEDYLASRGA
jgi:hypothetical protein